MSSKTPLVILLVLLGFTTGVRAQARLTGADVDGTVVDASGAVSLQRLIAGVMLTSPF